ncbi:AraC family transcriptional regulator [Acidovorax sp. NCPPB 4044]|uniref:AraC family transcriptional regulator n=1 Tax=Acidovorax sp. NCPPB 4044 TaxID=2940490 RepID=UPI002304B650|nr:AraC family transcriptional regulator [Acidovorax sp. NCPPB 4044]MDA8519203.1 AraC family transcriptional regulator [Acidovorax sp. NCPPB 4044]
MPTATAAHAATTAPTARPPVAATPMAFVRAIAHAYAQRGLDPARALAAAQIAPGSVKDPHARITALQMEALSAAAMRELDDEALGWFSRRLPWGSYGMLARASISAPTLGLALRRWCRHHALLADDIGLHLDTDGGIATLSLSEHRDLGALREFCTVSVLRNALGLSCWFIDSRLPLLDTAFPFAAPPHAAVYALLFGAAPRFGAPRAALRFDARYLALPLRRDEAALQQMLQRALPLTVRQYRRDRLLAQRVRQALAQAPEQACSAESLAAQLHVSARTLHRQLKEEGASLQSLKDEARQQRARDLLHRTDRPIKQVAEAAGFASEKSFMRAFRHWTGLSPTEYRRRQRAGAVATPPPPLTGRSSA